MRALTSRPRQLEAVAEHVDANHATPLPVLIHNSFLRHPKSVAVQCRLAPRCGRSRPRRSAPEADLLVVTDKVKDGMQGRSKKRLVRLPTPDE